jgi:hypothetical protein
VLEKMMVVTDKYPEVAVNQKAWIWEQIDAGNVEAAKLLYFDKKIGSDFYYSHADALAEVIGSKIRGIKEVKIFKWNRPSAERGSDADVAMREVATGFIGEFKTDKRKSSTLTSLGEIGISNYYDYSENRNVGTSYTGTLPDKGYPGAVIYDYKTTVMLARNGGLKNKPLAAETKRLIDTAKSQGAEFILGDMEGVDTQFMDYLNEIGATYSIYGHGRLKGISDKAYVAEPVAPDVTPKRLINAKKVKLINAQDVSTFNSFVDKAKGKFPKEFFTSSTLFKQFFNKETGKREGAPQNSIWMLQNNKKYDLIERETGEVLIANVDLSTGMQEIAPPVLPVVKTEDNSQLTIWDDINNIVTLSGQTVADSGLTQDEWDSMSPQEQEKHKECN